MQKRLLAILILSSVTGCSSDAKQAAPWELAPTTKAPDKLDDQEQERIRVMKMVKVLACDVEPCLAEDWPASWVTDGVLSMCRYQHQCIIPTESEQLDCGDSYVISQCDIAADTCAVNTLTEIASASNAGVPLKGAGSIPDNDPINIVIPPQSEASRLAILLEARSMAQRLAFKSTLLLNDHIPLRDVVWRGLPGQGVAGVCHFADSALLTKTTRADGSDRVSPRFVQEQFGTGQFDGRTVAAVVVEGITTGERVMREVSSEAAQKMLNVAEWDRGSTDSFVLGQQRVFSRPGMSRATAAHLLVGGSEGLRLDTAAGTDGQVATAKAFCSTPNLTPSGVRALKAFRQTGIAPSRILDTTSVSELVEGTAGNTGSVKQRLALILGKTVTSATEELGLSLSDFSEARQFLADELRAFNRSRTASVAPLGTFQRFAATSTEPPIRPAAYYTAIARAEPVAGDYYNQISGTNLELTTLSWESVSALGVPPVKPKTWDVATFEGTLQSNLLAPLRALASAPAALAYELRPLYLAAQTMQNSETAVVRLTRTPPQTSSTLLIVGGAYTLLDSNTVGLRLVVGEDQMECALKGTVEGGSCTVNTGFNIPYRGPNGSFSSYGTTLTDKQLTTFTLTANRSYILGKKSNGDVALIASLPVLNRQGASPINIQFAVMPDLERQAADVLRPSPKWCARAAVECNNNLFDERMPLENELNDDGNGTENSWKYYLNRAKDAASAADQLGELYLNAQLSADNFDVQAQAVEAQARERVQGYLETLQSSCGISMDADSLLKMFGTHGMLEDLSSSTCTDVCGNIPDPKHIRQCIAGSCVIVPTLLIGQQDNATASSRLARCLGAGEQIPLTVFGSKPVCVHNTNVLKNACLNDANCPRVVPDGNDPATYCSQSAGQQDWTDGSRGWKAVTSKLGFYDTTAIEFKSLLAREVERLGTGRCRYIIAKYDGGWFKMKQYGPWLGSESGQDRKECTPKNELTQAQRDAGYGYDPATTEVSQLNLKYPLWLTTWGNQIVAATEDGPVTFDGQGAGVEMTACPTETDLTNLPDTLDIDSRLWLLQHAGACLAVRAKNALGRRLLADMPKSVLDGLNEIGPLGVFPEFGGDYAQLIADLRGGLIQQSDNTRLINDEFEGYSNDLKEYGNSVKEEGIRKDLNTIQAAEYEQEKIINTARLEEEETKQDGALTVSLFAYGAHAITTGGYGLLDVSGPAAAIKGDEILDQERRISEAQGKIIDLKLDASKAQDKLLELDKLRHQLDLRKSMRRRISTIKGYITQARTGMETADAKLAALENLRFKAKRALDAAIAAASPQLLASEKKLVKVAGTIAQLDRARYQDAYGSAVRLAFLAKRAIEIRLGVHFAEMTEKLPLLDAPPASWENDICTASGIDYDRLQKADGTLPKAALNGFIGTYVRKLENVVDAYQLQYAFRQGADTLTVSLKDDVFRTAADCSVPSKNLLFEASGVLNGSNLDLGQTPTGPSTALHELTSTAWMAQGCSGATACIFVGNGQIPVGPAEDLANATTTNVYTNSPGAALQQKVNLKVGRYLLSWYQRSTEPSAAFTLAPVLGTSLTPLASGSFDSHTTADGSWVRYYALYQIGVDGDFNLSVKPTQGTGTFRYVSFGAPMLEEAPADDAAAKPTTFATTGASRMVAGPCRDIDGKAFRDNYWTYHCESTCGALAVATCADASQVQRCFWEASFALTEKDIMAGRVLQSTGFAGGNFNYRLDTVALNLVATGPRNCEGIGGSSCFGAAYVPYSLLHQGPFTVKNHAGNLVEVPLFNGRIEMAKGLAAERYLTNPLGSADRMLLEPYTRTELQGRPLDGNYVIRIWDDPGFRFESVEDVQLLVNYRYWTPAE